MRTIAPTVAALISVALIGCGQSREEAFQDVQKQMDGRTTARIHWNQGGSEDANVAASVSGLLAKELSADASVQIALLNNRALQATYEELGVAQADLVRAGLLKNPVFDVDAKFARGGGVRLEMSLVEDFLDLFFIPLRKRIAETAFEGAKLRVSGAVIDLASQVRTAVYRLQMAAQSLEMRRTVVEAASAAYDLSQRLRAAGNITKLDLTQQRSLLEESKLRVGEAEVELVEDRERLNTLMGLWGQQTTWSMAPRLPDLAPEEPAMDDVERRAIDRSLDLAVARTEIQIAAQRLGIARPFGAVSEADLGVAAEKEIEGTWAAGPAVSVPLPIFNFGQASVKEAQADLRRKEDLYASQAIEIRSRARTARARVLASRARVTYLQQVMLPLRRAVLDETQLQYNGMLASPFALIRAKQAEIDTGADYIQAIGNYWISRAALDEILAGRMPATDQPMGMSGGSSMSGNSAEGAH